MFDISRSLRVRFLLAGTWWSAVLLVALRSRVGERAIVAPFAAWQAALAAGVPGGSAVTVDLSCSGSDVIALSIAAILAYPVTWGRRLAGVALAAVWLASLNAIRIATLVRTAQSPLFVPLHVYIWPAALILAATLFVFVWIWTAERGAPGAQDADRSRKQTLLVATPLAIAAYAAATPWLAVSDTLQRAAIAVANISAAVLRAGGAGALTGGSTLVVAGQSFFITPECITTPLMPVYLAWALAWPRRLRHRALALLAFLPLFFALSIVRLLTVALPALIGPPLFLTHAFYQLLVAVLLIAAVAQWRGGRDGERAVARRLVLAAGVAVLSAIVLARPYTAAIEFLARASHGVAPHAATTVVPVTDIQGVTAIMPGYELALILALWIAWFGARMSRSLLAVVAAGAILQVVTLLVIGEARVHIPLDAPAAMVRAISILTPVALVAIAGRRSSQHAERAP